MIKPNRRIESVIGDELPRAMSAEQRRQQVIKLLKASDGTKRHEEKDIWEKAGEFLDV